ncbi:MULTISPECIES: carbohydrate ABC transporter permease [unclassified Nocardiopsis]|uniref:carbohydrate ABC transporter permease n=1 Tax=unclassified Nocardiopsis TaxID=2649073 RepID=UPI00066A4802|nr:MULTISPECIES: carbohydrate ABC transporter permease [unclassified Nocardiopsis]MBQ1080468.1 carbohydrate ABC transporter permease [Nocardiopsis sp. B62]
MDTHTADTPSGEWEARVRASRRRGGALRLWRVVGKAAGVSVLLFFTLFPVYFMLMSAFSDSSTSGTGALLPTSFTLDNFVYVMTEGNFGTFLRNSLTVAGITVAFACVLSMLAAVAVARFRFRFRTAVLVMILIVQMVPLEALVIPLFIQVRDLQMLNTVIGLSIVYVALSLPLAVWMMRGFVAAVPKEVEEAAYIDGATWPQMFWKVLFPLVAPGLVATAIFSFIVAWNEFVLAFTFMTQSSNYTVAVGLRQFFGQYANDWGHVMAASTIITIPVMVFFVLVQRWMVSGLVQGAVKG